MPRRKQSFGGSFDASFKGFDDKKKSKKYDLGDNDPYKFTPDDYSITSRIRFYDHDSLWSRWRRGYDLYAITQSYLGSNATERNTRGDFRMYVAFQQFPGVFIPARVFTFPSSNSEIGEQMVAVRDTNSFSFYNFGLPIQSVRYLTAPRAATYSQVGTTITVTLEEHGFFAGDSVFLSFTSGSAVNDTLTITSKTLNTFTCTASAAVTTAGNVQVRQNTAFDNPIWTEMRVGIRFIPTPVNFFAGERLADRVIERDPGIVFTYSQTTTTITVNCTAPHGLSTGNEVLLVFFTGVSIPGLYDVTVTSPTQFTVTSVAPATTSGTGLLSRRIRGYNYNDYVGYTVTGADITTNEILFQRDDSYGNRVFDPATGLPSSQGISKTIVPAHRGFEVGRYLTTEIRYQCTCPDFLRRETYNFYKDSSKSKFPRTPAGIVKPGERFDRDGNVIETRDDIGVYNDFGYVPVNNFYQLPGYEDTAEFSYPNLLYYQPRWCKHIYAAMWSIVHDEGNDPINLTGFYEQAGGPNITINAENHQLGVNTRIQLEFTSGNAISGEYTVSQVIDDNNFVIIYPFTQTTSGYCQVQNLKNHEYVGAWLLEPTDQPIGDALEKFYERLTKENERTKQQAERLAMMGYGMPWTGAKEVTGAQNQPVQVGDFDANLVSMMMTDSIRRKDGELNRDGQEVNTTTNMLLMMNKVFNIDPQLIQDTKIGMLDQPLTDYASDFQFGEINGGLYLNGEPVPSGISSTLDCTTYNPFVPQVIIVDSGLYINI
jgi:hypothetical protein